MSQKSKHIIVIAGEASGDLHAANLINAIKAQNPNTAFSGIGGPKMKEAGLDLYADLDKLAVVGLIEVIKNFFQIRQVFNLTVKKVIESQPDAVILVDYPGFNLWLARVLKQKGVTAKIIYYITPKLWAWNKKRVHSIKKYVDKLYIVFKFEEDFYAQYGIEAEFIGHPLVDMVKSSQQRNTFLTEAGLSPNKTTIALLPGSRTNEIKYILPVLLKTAENLYAKNADLQFVVCQAYTVNGELLSGYLKNAGIPVATVVNATYDGVNASDFCIVASGTATLETAILNKPMVVVYKISQLTWTIAEPFVTIPFMGLPNILAGKEIVPECLQGKARPDVISKTVTDILEDNQQMSQIKRDLKEVKDSLGKPGACHRAAESILEYLEGNKIVTGTI